MTPVTKEGRKSVSNWTCVKVSIWAFCARMMIVPAFSPDFNWAVNLPCLAWTWNPGCSGEASVPINSPSLACRVTTASQLERLPFSSTSCPSTVANERPSAGMRDSRVLIASLTGVPLTLIFTELRIASDPATLAERIFSPACRGTPYQVCVTVLLASSNSDRPIELGLIRLPLTKSSTLVLLGIWITTVAAGESITALTVGESMVMRGDVELVGVVAGAGVVAGVEVVAGVGVVAGAMGSWEAVGFWAGFLVGSAVFTDASLPVTFSAGFSMVMFWESPLGSTVGSTFESTFGSAESAIASAFTDLGSTFVDSILIASTFTDSTFTDSFGTDRVSTGLVKDSCCLISGSLISVATSEITSALTVGAINSNITCGKVKIASFRRGAEVFFIILLHPVESYY